MRRYETIVIIDPDLDEDGRTPLLDQIKEQIDQYNGRLVKFDMWGNRKLSYKIRKKLRGHYVRVDYCGTNELVNEMERRFKINDAFLKFMTVLLDKEVDLEAIEAEIADEEKKATEAREKALLAAEKAESEEAKSEKAENKEEAAATPTDKPLSENEAGEPVTDESKSDVTQDEPEPEATQTEEKETVEISTDALESDKKE